MEGIPKCCEVKGFGIVSIVFTMRQFLCFAIHSEVAWEIQIAFVLENFETSSDFRNIIQYSTNAHGNRICSRYGEI